MSSLLLLVALAMPHGGVAPGGGHLAVGLGIEAAQPVAELRIGLADWLGLDVSWRHDTEAPLLGGAVRIAAGSPRDQLFAHAWLDGHVRARVDLELLSGFDVGLGLGMTGHSGPFALGIDGGVRFGVAAAAVDRAGIDDNAADQRGGMFGVQRLRLVYHPLAQIGLELCAELDLPFAMDEVQRSEEALTSQWVLVTGARAFVRF